MDQTEIVTASELSEYGETTASEQVFPELVWMLIKESVPDLTVCRIPYGDAVNQSGLDGFVETQNGCREFVPSQRSFWEIGTGGAPRDKATADFKKRTEERSSEDRSQAHYVFVTPHAGTSRKFGEPQQTEWIKERSQSGWKSIKILDGITLANWLREFPAIGKWLLKKMGRTKTISGFTTPAEHWENLQSLAEPPLPAKIFLIGRDEACKQLERLFRGELKQLIFTTESELDTADFVSAFLASLDKEARREFSNKCLFVKEEDAWLAMTRLKTPHVLVADSRLDLDELGEQLQLEAQRNKHAVVYAKSGAWSSGAAGLIRLRSPSASMLHTTLTEAGYSHDKTQQLATAGAESLSSLKRFLRGYSEIPPYATREGTARLLAQAVLAGRWHGGNQADIKALETLLGKSYGEWIEMIRPETLRSDTPLIQRNESWKVISRTEAWAALGPRITNDDLDKFQQMAVTVLGEDDPRAKLSSNERLMSAFSGKVLQHSESLRKGIAETVALLGSKPKTLSQCSLGKPEVVALLVVRQLLKDANWVKWISLNSYLPLLAEAAPDEFMDAVEAGLLNPENPFKSIFNKEESGVMGWNYMTGLLWALETLAWKSDYLSRVTLILGDLAAIDPGGNWANRPSNSLSEIYVPWFPQTIADIPKRISAIESLLREQPAVCWKLILSLLPSSHGISMGSHKPIWRDYIPSTWSDKVSGPDYWKQVTAYAEVAAGAAKTDLAKLTELIDRLPDLPRPAFDKILEHLVSGEVLSLSETERLPLWEALTDLSRKHRFFHNADWRMPTDVIEKIEKTTNDIAPQSPNLIHRRLFSNRDHILFEGKHNIDKFEDLQKKLETQRQEAALKILNQYNLSGVLEFVQNVASPEKVGVALGIAAPKSLDADLFPKYLNSEMKAIANFISGFIWGRLGAKNWEWVDALPIPEWKKEEKIAFLVLLPFTKQAWQRAERLLDGDVADYWKKAYVNPWAGDADILYAIEKLLDNGRARPTIGCFSPLIFKKISFPHELATRALLQNIVSSEPFQHVDHHDILELIKWLQDNPSTDQNALFQIEWNFLRFLDHHFGGSPKTLEKRMAADPEFFCEVVRAIFRSEKEKAQPKEPTEQQTHIATNAYHLLHNWSTIPGIAENGSIDGGKFSQWLKDVKRISAESGHLRIAMTQVGQVLAHAPKDSDGLWIHHCVADALNAKDANEMRSGYVTGKMNMRGVFSFTHGNEEKKIAAGYREQAEELEKHHYTRFATALREMARHYDRDAEREANRDPYSD